MGLDRPAVGPPATVVAGGTAQVTVTNTVQRLYAGLQVTKTLTDPDGGVLPGAQFTGVWECRQGGTDYSGRFTVGPNATTTLFTPTDPDPDRRVPATSVCSVTEDTPDPAKLRDGSFAWDKPVLSPPDIALVAGQTANLGIANTVIRVYSDVTITKVITGPALGLVDPARKYTGEVSCQYRDDAPIVATWSATTSTPALHPGVLVGSRCTAIEDPPGATGQPVTGDRSYVWEPAVISDPVTVTPPGVATPPIVVTNPTKRLFGTFTVAKSVTGATEGIVDPSQPFPMSYICEPGTGEPIEGTLEVPATQTRTVGPERQIPVASVCTLTEPTDGLPALIDSAWNWNDPTFTVDGIPAPVTGRTITFTIPEPQEDKPEPTVAVAVTNSVTKTPGAFTVTKSSDPASGTQVQPGSTITYTLTVDSIGTVPVHDVVLTDDLSGVLAHASLVDGSVVAPSGTSAAVDAAAEKLVWTVGAVPNGEQRTLTYQVVVDDDAYDVPLTNLVTSPGSENCDPSLVGAGPGRTMVRQATAASCSTTHQTPPAPPSPPTPPGPGEPSTPGLPGTGFPLWVLIAWALALVALGALVLIAARRRRP